MSFREEDTPTGIMHQCQKCLQQVTMEYKDITECTNCGAKYQVCYPAIQYLPDGIPVKVMDGFIDREEETTLTLNQKAIRNAQEKS